jgi:DNA-binding transcriptional ArsR family regulator
MQHHPIGSFDWKRIIKRAELPRTTKLIASFLGDFANADGSNAHPGVLLLAEMAGVTDRTVKTHLKVLREAGLIEKTKHSRMLGQADVYRLTVPAADHAPVPMRLDPDGERLDTALKATTSAPDALELVDNPVDKAVDNRSDRASETGSYVKVDAALGEAGRRSKGSQLHPTNQTNPYQPFSGLPQATNSLAAAAAAGDPGRGRGGLETDEAEYRAAHEILMSLADIEPHMTVAIAELAAAGFTDPTNRQLVIRAADIVTRPSVPDRPASSPDAAAGRLG